MTTNPTHAVLPDANDPALTHPGPIHIALSTTVADSSKTQFSNLAVTEAFVDLPRHVTTEHVIVFLDVVGLIRLSATCRTWYVVRRSVIESKLSAERAASAADPIEFAGSLDFSPHRAHRYAFWLSMCPRSFVEAIVDRHGKECTDVLEAMVMAGRKKAWPWMDGYHAFVFRDVMFWCGASEIGHIRRLLDARTIAYTTLGLINEPDNDVFFANRVV